MGAYVFRNRWGTRLKIVRAEVHGVWLCERRLHKGSFVWPRATARTFDLNLAQFEWLIAGVDWQLLSARTENIQRLL